MSTLIGCRPTGCELSEGRSKLQAPSILLLLYPSSTGWARHRPAGSFRSNELFGESPAQAAERRQVDHWLKRHSLHPSQRFRRTVWHSAAASALHRITSKPNDLARE